jgi:hypothetical protein
MNINIRIQIAALICFFSIVNSSISQTPLLPIVKNGRWCIYDVTKSIELPRSFIYVNTFDELNYANYSEGNKNGIINRNGEIIFETHSEITQLGNGNYSYTNANQTTILNVFKLDNTIYCDNYQTLSNNWYLFTIGDTQYYQNIYTEEAILFSNAFTKTIIQNDYLIFQDTNSICHLYSDKGLLIDQSIANYKHNSNYLYYKGDNAHFLNTSTFSVQFKTNDIVVIFKDTYKIRSQSKTTIKSLDNNSTIIDYPCDDIVVLNDYYLVKKNGKSGLINQQKKLLIPIQHQSIVPIKNGFIVENNDLQGYIDSNYLLRIPCEFRSIAFNSDFIYVDNYLWKKGLYHPTTYEEILPAMFITIRIEDTIIKAYNESKMVLIKLDENQKVKDKLYIDNALTINKRYNDNSLFDKRLFKIGWYYDTVTVKSKLSYIWGLKDYKDSVIKKPTNNMPIFVENGFFSIVKSRSIQIAYLNTLPSISKSELESPTFKLINFSTGKTIRTPEISYIDTSDFKNYNYCRFRHPHGMGYIKSNEEIKLVTYIDLDDNEYNRFCHATSIKKTTDKSLLHVNSQTIFPEKNQKSNLHYEFIEARWNFLDKNGDSLFQTNFDFAQKFYKKTAIVKKETGWGVVNSDSIVIPCDYSSITRVKELGDTLFLVSQNQRGKIYLDSNLVEVNFDNHTYFKNLLGFIIFNDKKTNRIINEKNQVVFEHSKSIKPYSRNLFVLKENKEYNIYTKDGLLVTSTPSIPENILFDIYFTTKIKNKFILLNFDNDTLIPFECINIRSTGNYIIAETEKTDYIYNQQIELLSESKKGTIHADTSTGNLIIQLKHKLYVFNSSNEQLFKWRLKDEIKHINNNLILTNTNTIYSIEGKEIELPFKAKQIQQFDNNYICIENSNGNWHIYDTNWNELNFTSNQTKKLVYHGKSSYSTLNKNKRTFHNFEQGIHYEFDHIKGSFIDGFLLAKKDSKNIFIDTLGEVQFDKQFIEHKPYQNKLSTVRFNTGWTLLDIYGNQKSYPSYSEIHVIHPNLYEIDKKPLYGLIDSNGKTILEVLYDEIKFLKNNIIQVISKGEIHYFKIDGTVIY